MVLEPGTEVSISQLPPRRKCQQIADAKEERAGPTVSTKVIPTFANRYAVTTIGDGTARLDFLQGVRENDADAELCAQVYLPPGGLDALRRAIDEVLERSLSGRIPS